MRWRPLVGSGDAVGHREMANGGGGAPGQERATPPFVIERLLQGTLLTRLRPIAGAVFEPGNQGQRPLRGGRHSAGTGQGLVAPTPRPAAHRLSGGDNCDSDNQPPHNSCHATMVRNSPLIDKKFV